MTLNCANFDDLLFDASPLAMETAARHAEECVSCAEKLADWIDIEQTARSMRHTHQNDLLWPRIERALREERRKQPSRSRWAWNIAASILIIAGLAGTMYYALRVQTHDALYDHKILQIAAVDEVERAEREHIAAIEQLEKVADAKLDQAETPLMISYKEKIMLLDDAIAECESQIEQNRQNAHLRKQLLAMYSDKQQTLQDVVREDNDVSNP